MKKTEKGCYVNRELSWLKFNERVLAEAEEETTPLCERLSFVSIFQRNLDEFFMVRVGSLYDELLCKGEIRENKTNLTSEEQIEAVLAECGRLGKKRDRVYRTVMGELKGYGVRLCLYGDLTKEGKRQAEAYFEREVLPLLSPTLVGRKQPFPFLRNGEIYAVVVMETVRGKEKIGIVPCGKNVGERLVPIPAMSGTFLLLEELILHFVSRIFANYRPAEKSLVRVTRSADISTEAMEEEEGGYRECMEEILRIRKKLSPVRLELTRELKPRVVEALCYHLGLEWDQVFLCDMPLDLSFAGTLRDMLRENTRLFYPRFLPAWPRELERGGSLLAQAGEKDVLLSYPFESMKPFLQLLHEAAEQKDVVSVKMTLYRLARGSKVAEALIEAAENGKEVVVLLELAARFDEENNIEWSRRLEEAGCRVIYGLEGLKVHSKLCLITRKHPDGIGYVTQIGTGNYNEKTASQYTDLSLITADPKMGRDAAAVFHALCMGETAEETGRLLVAPDGLRDGLAALIEEEIAESEAGRPAYIGLKMNSLTDKALMEKLAEASGKGVTIDLIIRSACCLLPGVPGLTERIHVYSVVGRFLEHSRIYLFGCGKRERIWISSADWMTRNMLRRVEVAAPLLKEETKRKAAELFRCLLSDRVKAWELLPDGRYVRRRPAYGEPAMNSQVYFLEEAAGSGNCGENQQRGKRNDVWSN